MAPALDSRLINAKAVLGNMVRRHMAETLDEAAFIQITDSLIRQLELLFDDPDLPGGPISRAIRAIDALRQHHRDGALTTTVLMNQAGRCRGALVDLEARDSGLVDDPIELTDGRGRPAVIPSRARWSPRVIQGGLAADHQKEELK